MKRLLLFSLALMVFGLAGARAQFGNFRDVPIDITAENTNFESGVATASGNVVIRYGETTIYSDYAQYNTDTRDVLVTGNVRIYREGRVFAGERAVYNLETKQLTAADFRGGVYPFFFSTETFSTLGANAYQARGAFFTTSDNSKPDWGLRARNVRIYPNDRIILRDVKLYIGQTPVFWFPYIYQSLNKEQGFSLAPGYSSTLGAYLFTRYTFPLTNEIGATLRLDLMSERGVGIGLDSDWEGGKGARDWGRFRSYYVHDINPEINKTQLTREPIDPDRYRISLRDRTHLTEDIYATININKLSDSRFLQDFEPGEFRRDPNPDNLLALTKWDENYTVTLLGRKQLNDFFDYTERLPELALDLKRQPIFGQSGLYYQGETSAGFLRRNFANDSIFPDYDSLRIDSFHEILFPKTLFGWLQVIPRVGLRGTFYSNTGSLTENDVSAENTVFPEARKLQVNLDEGGSTFRGVVEAGLETSFKLSRAYEQVQSRKWGLDGFRHIMQPYMDFSFIRTTKDPREILQFDRLNPSTQLPPVDLSEFTAIDTIDNAAVLRLGIRNRFQTRRDNQTINWLEWNGFFDINIDRPDYLDVPVQRLKLRDGRSIVTGFDTFNGGVVGDEGTFSNLHSRLRWTPVPWVGMTLDAQFPVFDAGFTEVNTSLTFMPNAISQFSIGHRYLSGNPVILDSNQLVLNGYLRIDDNWGFSVREVYEFEDNILQQQQYLVHRDLSSWVASFGLVIRDNSTGAAVPNRRDDSNPLEYGLVLTFTLKDLPNVRLPLNFDPEGAFGGAAGSSKSR